MYKLTHVTKLYQKGRTTVPAVRDLNLVIEDGEWLAVQGRTGHGKSTLLNLLGGLDRPTEGRVELDGADLGELSTERTSASSGRRRSQDRGPKRSGSSSRPSTWCPRCQRPTTSNPRSSRALVKEPRALLADEPAGNLDEDTRDEIIRLLGQLWQKRGLTVVLVTHNGSITRRAQMWGYGEVGGGDEQGSVLHPPGHQEADRDLKHQAAAVAAAATRITNGSNGPDDNQR